MELAATRLIAMRKNKGKSIAACLHDHTSYIQNPDKTEQGELVSSYQCSPLTVDEEFMLTKRLYEQTTGRRQKSDVIAYQVRQSFRPGEVTPEEANRIGYEFAERFLKGKHAFIVATHTDRAHIHNHIIYNSTALDGTRKFRDFFFSALAVQRLSDLICLEHQLSVIQKKPYRERQKRILYIANSEEYRGWFPLFTVMLGTGCRIGEVLGLRWQDVDFKNRTISINHNLVYRVQEDGTCTNHVNSPKTKAGIRIIPMIDEVFDAFLEEYQYQKVIGFCTDEIDGYSGFVFCTGDGKVYLPNAINRTIRSICADYNKEEESKAKEENRDPVLLPKFSCHILRHTFCTRFCENETNLKVIQEIMGHADISTTMDVYAEATQEKKKESMTSLQSALLVR